MGTLRRGEGGSTIAIPVRKNIHCHIYFICSPLTIPSLQLSAFFSPGNLFLELIYYWSRKAIKFSLLLNLFIY